MTTDQSLLFRATLICIASLASSNVLSSEELDVDVQGALNEHVTELLQCTGFYTFGAEALRVKGMPEDAARMEMWADATLASAYQLGTTIGVSEKALLARTELITKDMAADIDNNLINISVLTVKYGDLCKEVTSDPEARFKYWLDRAAEGN
jgi:hypothetical protein